MVEHFVKKYLQEQKASFFENYKMALKSQDVDAVHDMRVSVKRLSTTIRMLNFEEAGNFRLKKCFKPVRFVYRNFGKIRDFQVLSGLLLEYQDKIGVDMNPLIKGCKQRTNFEINLLHTYSKHFQYLALKRNFRLIEYHIKSKTIDGLKEKIILFADNQEEGIKKICDNSHKTPNLHNVRKKIKDIGYLMEMSEGVLPGFASKLKYYKELGSLLGNWHDCIVLRTYLQKQVKADEQKNIDFEKIVNAIILEKEELENRYFSTINL